MPKEFLHEVVKKREESSSHDVMREYMRQSYERMTRDATMAYATDPWSSSDSPNIRGTHVFAADGRYVPTAASIPEHLSITPQARMNAQAMFSVDYADERHHVARFVIQAESSRSFRRTDVHIGDVPNNLQSAGARTTMARHAYELLHQHGCYPDYNVTNVSEVTNGIFITYRCASCNSGFTLGY